MALQVGVNCGLVSAAPTADPAGTNSQIDYARRTLKITTTDAVVITEIGWYCDNATEESNFEIGIYDHDAVNNRPGNLIYVERTNAKGTGAGWKKKNGLSWVLDASTIYWIAIQLDDTATTTNGNYGAISGQIYFYNTSSQTTLPDVWGATSSLNNYAYAIYALYEVITAPTVTTQAATDVTTESCTGNGNITDTGGVNCTRRGFCYMEGTEGDPTTANSVVYDDGDFGTGAYQKSITGLSPETGYRVRAYAVNSAGTAYGSTVQVTTEAEVGEFTFGAIVG